MSPLPEVEHIVQRVIFLAARAVVGSAHHLVYALHQCPSAHLLAADIHCGETAIGVQGYGGMIEQEPVAHEEERAVLIEPAQVLLHLLRFTE